MSELSEELRRLRELRGLTQKEVGSRVGYGNNAISNWESGVRTIPRRATIEDLDKLYGARGTLVELWEDHKNGKRGGLPPWLKRDGALEERAAVIEVITTHLVPGLLQSPLYAREVFCAGRPGDPMSVIDDLVRVRCGRLEELGPDLRVTAVLPETALTSFPPDVRREQAARLLDFIAGGRVTVNLVPRGQALAGVTAPFQVYRLRDGTRAASADWVNGNVIVDDPDGIARLEDLLKSALRCVLPTSGSLERIKEIADG